MLCGSLAPLNGSQVSIWPVARGGRCTPAKPLFCAQTLPSTCELCGLTMLSCAASMLRSLGSCQNENVSVLRLNLVMVAWYMLPSHRLPSRSVRSARNPVGKPGLCSGTGYSVTLPVLVSTFPIFCSPKCEYQALPS